VPLASPVPVFDAYLNSSTGEASGTRNLERDKALVAVNFELRERRCQQQRQQSGQVYE